MNRLDIKDEGGVGGRGGQAGQVYLQRQRVGGVRVGEANGGGGGGGG